MTEYFIVANSKAAPFFSDTSMKFVNADNPEVALSDYVKQYDHPAGLYAANVYANSDAYHKNMKPLAIFRSDKSITRRDE